MAGALLVVPLGQGPAQATSRANLVKSAHVAFETCPARTTVLTATLLQLTFTPTQPILVGVSVRNEANHPCGSNGSPSSLLGGLGVVIGPCGNVVLHVENASGHNVFPAPRTTPCAAHSSTRLTAHHTLHTVGIWNQQEGSADSASAPRGQYRIVVDKKIVFNILLVGPSGTLIPPNTIPTKPRPPGPCGRVFNLVRAPASTTTTTTTTTTTKPPTCPIGRVGGPSTGIPTPTVPAAPTTTTSVPGRAAA
jgi:hypothetical protein